MSKELLNQKEQRYADTRGEAEEIVTEAKENKALMMQKITEKHNKYGTYYLVDLTYSYKTPREIMDDDSFKAPEGQISIEEIEVEDERETKPKIELVEEE